MGCSASTGLSELFALGRERTHPNDFLIHTRFCDDKLLLGTVFSNFTRALDPLTYGAGCRLKTEYAPGTTEFLYTGLECRVWSSYVAHTPRLPDFETAIVNGRSMHTPSQMRGVMSGAVCRLFDQTDPLTWSTMGRALVYRLLKGFRSIGYNSECVRAIPRLMIPGIDASLIALCSDRERV